MKMADTKTKTPEEYLKEPYARVLIPEEEGGFSAEILEFPGCFSQGETADEAMKNLEEAAENWIEATLAQEQEIPAPSANYSHGGKVALRLPRATHRKAIRLAEREGVSLNTFLVAAIEARIGAKEIATELTQQLKQMVQEMEQRLVKQTAKNDVELAVSLVKAWEQPTYIALGETASNSMAAHKVVVRKEKETIEVIQ